MEAWTPKVDMESIFPYESVYFGVCVNLAQQALDQNIEHGFMMKSVMEYLQSYFDRTFHGEHCKNGQTNFEVFIRFPAKFNLTYETTMHKNISSLALKNGFELYSSLLHCPNNKRIDLVFWEFFLLLFPKPEGPFSGTFKCVELRPCDKPSE